jgi:hypothetical protein
MEEFASLEMHATGSSETLATIYRTARLHIAEATPALALFWLVSVSVTTEMG